MSSPFAPRISVIAPAFNEATTIEASVRALMSLDYPNLELIVVNDGSTDHTIEVLCTAFTLVPVHPLIERRLSSSVVHGVYHSLSHPHLLVVDKVQGGKSDAMNVGIDLAAGALFCAIDSDTLVEAGALTRLVRPLVDDPSVVAVGGMLRVLNAAHVRGTSIRDVHVSPRWLVGVQTVEYLRAFFLARMGWNRLGGDLIVSGAFGLFRVAAVRAAGGYAVGADGEDMELVVRLRRRGAEQRLPVRVQFVPDAVAWTEVPEHLPSVASQRRRWHRGLAETLWTHAAIIGRPRYGLAGMLAAPFYVVAELLGPVVEMIGAVAVIVSTAMRLIDFRIAALIFVFAYGIGVIVSVGAILLEESAAGRHAHWSDRARLLLWAVVEPLGYRQLTVLWRLQGLWQWMRGDRGWGTMVRREVASVTPLAITGLLFVLAAVAAGSHATVAHAQAAAPLRLSMEASVSRDRLTNGRAPWQEHAVEATLSRSVRTRLLLSLASLSRFDLHDVRLAMGGSLPISSRWTVGSEGATSTTGLVLPRLSVEGWVHRRLRDAWGIQATALMRAYTTTRVHRYALEVDRYVGPYRVAYTYGVSTLDGRSRRGVHRMVASAVSASGSQLSLAATTGQEVEFVGADAPQALVVREADIQFRQRVHSRWLVAATMGVEAHGVLYTRAFSRLALRYQPSPVLVGRARLGVGAPRE
ncbi:glycosyltransferase [Gemmatimonas sp.]|uniref:glycosyltransferase n=1 Tax=Gemmatimonas sp. TaxID=1962908 RepID=UPI00286E96B8|nr:glycosyltransferase [Gemmatimonas sp.]